MRADKIRQIVFFTVYMGLLLYGLVWIDLPYSRDRVQSTAHIFYVLIAFALCYVLLRAYLVLSGRASPHLELLWLAVDIGIISSIVMVTGGIRSEAAILYLVPIITSAVLRQPLRTAIIGVLCGVVYVVICLPLEDETARGWLTTRLVLIAAFTAIAASWAWAEVAKVREIAALREREAIGEFRARLSQEMHDGIQHYLVSMASRLFMARNLIDSDPRAAAEMAVEEVISVRRAGDELRYLITRMRSPDLESQSFPQALREHALQFAERAGLETDFDLRGEAHPMPADLEHAAFRIVQEALTNVEKHAEAKRVRLRLSFEPARFSCSVADDGVGFEMADGPSDENANSFGLSGMRRRAEALGGELTLISQPGTGTEVAFTAPL